MTKLALMVCLAILTVSACHPVYSRDDGSSTNIVTHYKGH